MKKNKIAFLIFDNFNSDTKMFFGDMLASLYSGFLKNRGINNDILLVLFNNGNPRNNEIVFKDLIEHLKKRKYEYLFLRSKWSPEIINKIIYEIGDRLFFLNTEIGRRKFELLSGARVSEMDFQHNFYPNFSYKIFGCKTRLVQRSSVLFFSDECKSNNKIYANPFYKKLLKNDSLNSWKGCSYCSSGFHLTTDGLRKLERNTRVRVIRKQIEYLMNNLPSLRIIDLVYPENYFDDLFEIVNDAKFNSLSFYINLRPDILVAKRRAIEKILLVMKKKKTAFLISNLGFENFSEKELLILNRNYTPDANLDALKIFCYFKKKYPENWRTQVSSASFILFEPFTAVSDLLINIQQINRMKDYFKSFAGLSFHKLRVIKNTPIFSLAQHSGLISNSNLAQDLAGLSIDGYSGEGVSYRFLDSKINKVFESFDSLLCSQNADNFKIANTKFLHVEALSRSLQLLLMS
jgi:hypothetical protein